jgi:hypothetical protein
VDVLVGLHRDRVDRAWRPIGVALPDPDGRGYAFRTSPHLADLDGAFGFASAMHTAYRLCLPWAVVVDRFAASPANAHAQLHSTFAFDAYQVPEDATLADVFSWHVLAGIKRAFPGGVPAT